MRRKQHDLSAAFHPSFTGSRQEQQWILAALGEFYVEEWFTDVLFRVKGGKEATVYALKAHPATGRDLIAAKIFRPRVFRAMRNDSLYKLGREARTAEGKADRRSRTARALAKRTRYGKQVDQISWCQHEISTLDTLYAAGVDVPPVFASSTNAILMEFVGDEHGGAPILHSVHLEPTEAARVFCRVLHNVKLMLEAYVVHADLSAYNVLYHEGEIRIIDVPQAVDAIDHPDAFDLFQRDMRHVCRHFRRQGVDVDADELTWDLWSHHIR